MAEPLVPLPPLIDRLTENEMRLIELARGGITLHVGSPAGRTAESLAERGYMKEVTLVGTDKIAWKLTGLGCELAYTKE
jgi:hypothetical protein